MKLPSLTVKERIDKFAMPIPESGCWIWTGSISPEGYARLHMNGKPKYAHRVAYEAYVGIIPERLDLDHLCRVRCCVNPAHLEPVTRSENLKRGNTGEYLKHKKAQLTHCPQGHPYEGDNLRLTTKGHRVCKICMRAAFHKWYNKRKAICV
jgi:HNH endonuclease